MPHNEINNLYQPDVNMSQFWKLSCLKDLTICLCYFFMVGILRYVLNPQVLSDFCNSREFKIVYENVNLITIQQLVNLIKT